jgi:Fe-S cluster biogenesis protein NfuA
MEDTIKMEDANVGAITPTAAGVTAGVAVADLIGKCIGCVISAAGT